ncbi:MAG TPA: caspase family protein [Oculatellaceae cyanobacterium]
MQISHLSTIRMTRLRDLGIFVFALMLVCSLPSMAVASDLVNAKDMFYQELKGGSNTAAGLASGSAAAKDLSVAYCLELHRGNNKPVLCNNRYAFRSGDGVRLHVKSSAPVYAYILLLQGSSGKQAILYPQPGSTESNRLEAGKECIVPPSGMIVFDDKPGVETLGVIFSPKPLDDQKALGTRTIPVDGDALTGIPQKVGSYSVMSSDGVYTPGEKAPGSGLVYVNSPDGNKPIAIAITLHHGDKPSEPPPSQATVTPSAPHPSSHAPSSGASGLNSQITDKWAFLVGVNQFANFPDNSLRYCVADATALRDYLVNSAGFKPNHVYMLTDEQATTANIHRVIEKLLPAAVRKDDLVLLYFSSHGTPSMRGENYIVTHDFDGKMDGNSKTGIPMSKMSEMIKANIPCNRVVTILDTCFSGNARDLDSPLVGCGQLILTACGFSETSLEDPRLGHGYFTYYLIDSLKGNRYIEKAFATTKNQVQNHTLSEHQHKQSPILKDELWKGLDVAIDAKPTNPRN